MYSQMGNEINLQQFYPKEMTIKQVISDKNGITLKMYVESPKGCRCPKCQKMSSKKHGTYARKIQDLPILGRTTWLRVNAYEYQCENTECSVITFVENISGFLHYYSRMTDRCEDFICTLAMETSCEGCARICRNMNVKISGDTVIRLLMKRYETQEKPLCSSTVGVDDFAFKKRNRYGTVIVDSETHRPVEILDGRDGNTLKEWLKKNQHIKAVTRDRASAYASAIQDVLPDAMQVADRFHLHQNLLEAIRSTLNSTVPTDIKIPIEEKVINTDDNTGKKNRMRCG